MTGRDRMLIASMFFGTTIVSFSEWGAILVFFAGCLFVLDRFSK